MTERPSRPELRHTILDRLGTFAAEVEWVGTGAHLAFADSIIEFADWLATCTEPVPTRGPGASRQAIDQALTAAAQAVADARRRRTTVNEESKR